VQRLRVRDGYFRDESGRAVYLVGANFWPKNTGPWMYRDPWNPAAIGADLRELAALGANAVRVFCFTPDFMPASDVVSSDAIERLASMIELAAKAGLWSIPTFLVGHMSGENWQTQWSRGRDWYTDPLLLDASELLVGTVASHFAGDARIAAWLLTNEWPLFAGRTSDEVGLRWAKRMCATLRAADSTANVSLGDGSWDVTEGQRSGLPSLELRDVIDFYGPHFYPKETDALRHSVFAGFAMRMLQTFRHPVLLEEFGCSSDQSADDDAAAYYRTVLWSAFGAGNCGALCWNSHDFTVADRPPYSHHPYELHFGVIRTDGSRKPQADEVARFAAFAAEHNPDEWDPQAPIVAIGRTSYYLGNFPFDWGWTSRELRDLFLQTFATCVMAGLDSSFVDLASGKFDGTQLLFVPCLQQVTTQDVAHLERFVSGGGSLYLSYGGEPWFPKLGAFIGAQLRIRYGLVEPPEDSLRLVLARDFGDLSKGTELRVDARGDLRRRAKLICQPREAKVVATDGHGDPMVFERRLGAGRVIFVTHPLEYYALNGLNANAANETWMLYRAIAHVTHALPARAWHSPVQSFSWRSKVTPGVRRVLLVNHAWEQVDTALPNVSGRLRDVESGELCAPHSIRLEAKGVRSFDITSD